MGEHIIKNEHDTHYDEIVMKIIQDIENKIQSLKNVENSEKKLDEIVELNDIAKKQKEKLSNTHFQFLKRSSFILYEKKLKELIKEIEYLKYTLIQNSNKIECNNLSNNYDDNFILTGNYYMDEENENIELFDNQIDINQYKLSFQNIANERIIKVVGETECSSLLLDNLTNCEIIILDVLSSVLIQKIKNCTIWMAAVESSVLIYNCVECNILTNSKQIRIHDARDTKFYINSMSSPIIENSSELSFFQYNLYYNGLSELLMKINVNKNSTKWKEVLDFNWQHSEEKSPNFCISYNTQEIHINIKKKDADENDSSMSNNKYTLENFPSFLKKAG